MSITKKQLIVRNKTKSRKTESRKTRTIINLNTDLISNKLKSRLDILYKNIKLDKNTYKDSIKKILKLKELYKNTNTNKNYKNKSIIHFAIVNFRFDGNTAKYFIINKKDIIKDTRIDNIETALRNLCKWIERTKRNSNNKINTCLLFWISDRFLYEFENIDKQLPICTFAQPKNMNYIMIPDGTFTVLSESRRYSNIGLNWEQQKQLFTKIEKNKKNQIFFRGKNTTKENTDLRQYIYDKLQNEKDNEFKNAMQYEFLTKENYKSIKEIKNYKFLLNLPGAYPWSTRLKYIYLAHSFCINIRVKTIINNPDNIFPFDDDEHYESFVDYIVPDSNCINIDMIYYYKEAEKNKVECEKVYNKIKEVFYEYKDKDENKDKKVINSYNLVNSIKTTHFYEYYYEILLRNQKLGMEPYVM